MLKNFVFSLLIVAMLLSACGGAPVANPQSVPTPAAECDQGETWTDSEGWQHPCDDDHWSEEVLRPTDALSGCEKDQENTTTEYDGKHYVCRHEWWVPATATSNVEAWVDLFTDPNLDPADLETLPEAVNEWIGQNCPYRQDFDVDETGEVYSICRSTDDEEVLEVSAGDLLALTTALNPVPGDEVLALRWGWNAERTGRVLKVILLAVAAEEALRAAGISYKNHSRVDHDPRFSQIARDKIVELYWKIMTKLNDPNAGPTILCAIVGYRSGATYIRILSSTDGVTGDMAWFGPEGWVGAFGGKDVTGFQNGWPRAATSYNSGLSLTDCLKALTGGLPGPTQYAP